MTYCAGRHIWPHAWSSSDWCPESETLTSLSEEKKISAPCFSFSSSIPINLCPTSDCCNISTLLNTEKQYSNIRIHKRTHTHTNTVNNQLQQTHITTDYHITLVIRHLRMICVSDLHCHHRLSIANIPTRNCNPNNEAIGFVSEK